jgi:hypothetical protein
MKLRRLAPTILAVAFCVAALGWAQYSFDGLAGSDSYFHTRAAERLSAEGFDRSFEATAFSTWSARYSDKDLLFHVWLIPFQWLSGGDLIAAGKAAMVGLYALYFGVFAFCLHRLRVRWPWLWILLSFLAGGGVANALLTVRPGALGVVFVMLEVVWLAERRGRALAVTVALHVLAHTSFALVPGLWFAAAVASWMRGGRAWGRGALWCGAGLAAGFLFNPYVPNNFSIAWDQVVQVALGAWTGATTIPKILFGPELLPAKTDSVVRLFPAYLPAFAAAGIFAATKRRLSVEGMTVLTAALMLLGPAFLSERFFRFFFPIVALAAARLWSELAGAAPLPALRRRGRPFWLSTALILGCLLYGVSTRPLAEWKRRGEMLSTAEQLRPAIEFIDRNAAPDDVVYHNFWWDFSILYHYRPQGRYIVALDPVFLLRHDYALFRKALAITDGTGDDAHRTIARDFGASWVYVPKKSRNRTFFSGVVGDPGFVVAYEDDYAVILRVQP